jgi:dihydroflavonol-4-reductase
MSRFWVAGASGFIGRTLVGELLSRGHEVVAVSRGGGEVHGIVVSPLDVCERAEVERSARGCDGAFFCVGKVSRDPRDAALMHRVHVQATQAALPALQAAGVPRVVYLSTSGTLAVGTDPKQSFDETAPVPHELIGRWPYYRSKYYAEVAALALNEPGKFEIVIVNPSLLLGPGDVRGSSNLDVRRLIAGSIPAVTRGGLAIVDVRDAAVALISAFERGRAGERYLISAANLSLEVFFGRLARLAGVKAPLLRMPANPALARWCHWAIEGALDKLGGALEIDAGSVDMGSHYWYCDPSKAERELGFRPRNIDETLRETVEDILRC